MRIEYIFAKTSPSYPYYYVRDRNVDYSYDRRTCRFNCSVSSPSSQIMESSMQHIAKPALYFVRSVIILLEADVKIVFQIQAHM